MEGFHIFQLVQVFFPSADIYTQKIFWWFASIESSIWKLSERTESAYFLLKYYSCFLSTNSHNPTTLLDRPGQQRESQRDRTAMPCEGWKGCHRMSFAPWSRENAILIGVWGRVQIGWAWLRKWCKWGDIWLMISADLTCWHCSECKERFDLAWWTVIGYSLLRFIQYNKTTEKYPY